MVKLRPAAGSSGEVLVRKLNELRAELESLVVIISHQSKDLEPVDVTAPFDSTLRSSR